jgi:hypothetical protein
LLTNPQKCCAKLLFLFWNNATGTHDWLKMNLTPRNQSYFPDVLFAAHIAHQPFFDRFGHKSTKKIKKSAREKKECAAGVRPNAFFLEQVRFFAKRHLKRAFSYLFPKSDRPTLRPIYKKERTAQATTGTHTKPVGSDNTACRGFWHN